jgi:hypothetical protein
MNPPAKVIIEAQSPGDSRSLFRLLIDGRTVEKDLTAAQLHLLIGEILSLIALPSNPSIFALAKLPASNDPKRTGVKGRLRRPGFLKLPSVSWIGRQFAGPRRGVGASR